MVDYILHRFLTDEEAEFVLNDCDGGVCGVHLFGLYTAKQILREGYIWPSIFKYCVNAVKWCHPFRVFAWKICSHPTCLHPIITFSPFTKWGVDFMDCNLASAGVTIILLWLLIISRNGKRLCPLLKLTVRHPCISYSIRLSPSSVSRGSFSLTKEGTFKTILWMSRI